MHTFSKEETKSEQKSKLEGRRIRGIRCAPPPILIPGPPTRNLRRRPWWEYIHITYTTVGYLHFHKSSTAHSNLSFACSKYTKPAGPPTYHHGNTSQGLQNSGSFNARPLWLNRHSFTPKCTIRGYIALPLDRSQNDELGRSGLSFSGPSYYSTHVTGAQGHTSAFTSTRAACVEQCEIRTGSYYISVRGAKQ